MQLAAALEHDSRMAFSSSVNHRQNRSNASRVRSFSFNATSTRASSSCRFRVRLFVQVPRLVLLKTALRE